MIFKKSISKLSDASLIERYRESGNSRWVGELYSRHAHLVFGTCLKYLKNQMEAEDATAEIFEKLLASLKEQEPSSFKNWIFIVSRNHCLMKLRKRKTFHSDEQLPFIPAREEEVTVKEEFELKISHLESALSDLDKSKPEQARCIRMFYLHQKCYQVIASETGLDLKKVKSNIQNGKRNLKMSLEKKNEERA